MGPSVRKELLVTKADNNRNKLLGGATGISTSRHPLTAGGKYGSSQL